MHWPGAAAVNRRRGCEADGAAADDTAEGGAATAASFMALVYAS